LREGFCMECNLRTTYFRDQASRTRSTGLSFLPKVVTEYSTRTGISANISRLINPSRSNSRNCCVNTFCEIRGMFSRRALKRSGFLDSESHQRITGFQRPPIKTSRCSMGHSLAIRLALISAPVTRYPFGSWYLCDGIKRIGSYTGGNEKRSEEQGTFEQNCESRAVRGQEKLHHQDPHGHPRPQKSPIAVSAAKSRTRCYRLTLWNSGRAVAFPPRFGTGIL